MTKHLNLLEHLYAALRSPLGIVLSTDNVEILVRRLKELRKQRSPEFDNIAVLPDPLQPSSQVWLGKRGPNAEE